MDIHAVLEYYAIICLAGTPLAALVVIILNKKTNLIGGFNKWLDGILGLDKWSGIEGLSVENTPSIEPNQGVTHIKLKVGGKYFCRLTSFNRFGRLSEPEWISEDEFVGILDKEHIFTALHCGKTKVCCQWEDESAEGGIQVYEFEVCPADPNWFAETFSKAVIGQKNLMSLANELSGKRRTAYNIPFGIQEFDYKKNPSNKVSLQTDKSDIVIRTILYLEKIDETVFEYIVNGLNERYELIPTSSGPNIWIHILSDPMQDEIDCYAILEIDKERKNGRLMFGRAWREYGSIEEFIDNIDIAGTAFSDMLTGKNPINNLKPVKNEIIQKYSSQRKTKPVTAEIQKSDKTDKQSIEDEPNIDSEPDKSYTPSIPDENDIPDTGGEEPDEGDENGEPDYYDGEEYPDVPEE